MSSRNHSENLLDVRLRHTLKNWVAYSGPPKNGREKLLAAAAQQSIPKPQRKVIKFNFGWSYYNGHLKDAAVHSLYGYTLDAIMFKTSLAMSIR